MTIKVFPVPQTPAGQTPGLDDVASGLIFEGTVKRVSLGGMEINLDQICAGYGVQDGPSGNKPMHALSFLLWP